MSSKIDIQELIIIHHHLREAEDKILETTGHKLNLQIEETEIIFNIANVVKTVSSALNIPLHLIVSSCREGEVKTARQISMYLLKKYMPVINNAQIARSMKRDRTTVVHSIKYAKDMIATNDTAFLQKLQIAEQAIIKLKNESKIN